MIAKSVTSFAPGSISNLGAGYDVIGVAIEQPGDTVIARQKSEPGLSFVLEASSPDVPSGVKNNVAAHVASLMLETLKPPFGVALTLQKNMPIGSGLGSSAASSVAAAVAVNGLMRKPLPKEELLAYVVEGERLASGAIHADNAAPSLLGGACLVRSYNPLDIIKLDPVKKSLAARQIWWVVVHPNIVVMTKMAREILPKDVPLKSAVRQWGNVGGLVAGLMTGDAKLVGRSMEDVIIEPVRSTLIPGFENVQMHAIEAGAYGCTLSGSGPSILAVTDSLTHAKRIGLAIARVFANDHGILSTVYISQTNVRGAGLVRSRASR